MPPAVLDLPRHGCLNVHTSLLPKYRGAAPIQWAVANGDTETGVTIMKMDVGLDTGDIVAQRRTPIGPEDDSATLHDRLAQTIWNRLRAFTPWPGAFTFWLGVPPSGGNATRTEEPAKGGTPSALRPILLKIWKAEVVEMSGGGGEILSADKTGIVIGCGKGALRILELQREGGRRLTAAEFLAGHALKVGETFEG